LLPARIPPKFTFFDLFPFSIVVRLLRNDQKQIKGIQYATSKDKKESPGAQNIPLEISLYLVRVKYRPSFGIWHLLTLFCVYRAPTLLSCSAEK
jgi:hypothetical protein